MDIVQIGEKITKSSLKIVESNVLNDVDTPGIVDMKLLNDTPGCVGIKRRNTGRWRGDEKAWTARLFEELRKERKRKEIQKKIKKSLKKVLRFSEF